MFILLTNKQKRKFAAKIFSSYEDIYKAVGRKMSASQKLDYQVRIFKLLKIKRNNGLEY